MLPRSLRRNPLSWRKRDSTSSSLQSYNSGSNRSIDEEITRETASSSTDINNNNFNQNASVMAGTKQSATSEFRAAGGEETSYSYTSSSTSNTRTKMVDSTENSENSRELIHVASFAKGVRTKIVRELEDVTAVHLDNIDIGVYLKYIADRRLVHMPFKGDQWDRVLREAEFFGLQIDEFSIHLKDIIPESFTIRDTALASCYLLLELGHNQSEALEPTFNAFYELGLLLSHTVRLQGMFAANGAIKYDLSRLYSSLVRLVGDVAVFYRQRINCISSGTVTIDFDAEFGPQVSDIWSQKEHLFNHMWAFKLRHKTQPIDIVTLRQYLLPTKESVKSFVYGRVADRKLRVDGTCEWIQHDLKDFLGGNNDIFTVTGDEGCGKSMLAAWVRERLERPINRTQFETISYTFSSDIPEEASSIALLKSLLSQLLETNVGDVALFDSLVGIFEHTSPNDNLQKLEADLWESLNMSLAAINKKNTNLVLVIDGLDEINGGSQRAGELHHRLLAAIKKYNKIQAVTFSRRIPQLEGSGSGSKRLIITSEHVRADIELFLANRLNRNKTFADEKSDQTKRNLVNQLADQARGSFLFAYLAVNLLSTGLGFNAFRDTISQCKSDVKAVIGELIKKVHIKEEYGESKTYNLFIFMIAAQRPLTSGEMTDLMGVSLSEFTVSPGADIWAPIRSTQGLVVVHRGTLRFKHSVVRKYVHNLCGTTLMSVEDAHRHLTLALMLFAQKKFTYTCEPSLEYLPSEMIEDCSHSHNIVRYMMRHWISHFRASSLCSHNGKLTLTNEFKRVFPDSVFFALFEWSTWQKHHALKDTIEMHELSLNIRSACLGEKHRAYLQNLIVLATLYKRSNDLERASTYFYRSSRTGQVVIYEFSPLVVSCTNNFLVCTDKITFTSRTTTATYREEMIKFMIEICRGKNGRNSDAVIKWHESLIKLYREMKEEDREREIVERLHAIRTARFPKGSKNDLSLEEKLKFLFHVRPGTSGGSSGSFNSYADDVFDELKKLKVTNPRRIKAVLDIIATYESRKQYTLAETCYVTLWRSVMQESRRQSASTEIHIQKLDIATRYIEFLKRINRSDEATNIMVCLWAEYENYKFESQILALRFKELAVLAKSFGIVSVSMSILNSVWGFFKSQKTIESEEALETATIITEVVEEIVEKSVTTKTTVIVAENVTKEVWVTTYNRCKSGKANEGFFKSSMALIDLYLKQGNWSEAENTVRKSLEVTWKEVLTTDTKLTIEGEFISARIKVANNLARCYREQGQFDRAEEIYLRVFDACFRTLHVKDGCVLEAAVALLDFYEEYHRHEKVIEIYNMLLKNYRDKLEPDHELTVETIYKLAAVYLKLGRKEAYDCYNNIVTIYTHNGHCQARGLDAAVKVLNHFHTEKRWAELEKMCKTLWSTFTHHHREVKFKEEMVELIYERYRYVLEVHTRSEFSVRYKLAIEYRDTATKVFGASSAIVLKAMISLAEVCETSEEHQHESIKIYEEVITRTKSTTVITETIVRTMTRRLSTLYVTVVTKGKATTSGTIERAIYICEETYKQLKIEFGAAHENTLTKLREIILLYKKLGSKEAHSKIVHRLEHTAVEIISSSKRESMTLHTAAASLANTYIASGMGRHGHDLLRQLRYLLLFPGFEGGEKDITIKMPRKDNDSKVSLVFLISFEQALNANTKVVYSYSEIMADVLLETILYEQYRVVASNFNDSSRIETILEHAGRLRFVWSSRGRTTFLNALDKKVFSLFTSRYAKHLGPNPENSKPVFDFYVGLLREIGEGNAAERETVDFELTICEAVCATTKRIMEEEKDMNRAHEVAKVGFSFANSQELYQKRRNNPSGYRLAEILAGIDVENWQSADAGFKEASLSSSKHVLHLVLAARKKSDIGFDSMAPDALEKLVGLLGKQGNFIELENLLLALWKSREVQRRYPDTVVKIGTLLVDAHFSASHLEEATALCETLYYNVRQSRGSTHKDTLGLADRLCILLRRSNRLRDAARVHRDVVFDLDEHIPAARGADQEERERLRAAADMHLDGMRRCGWGSGSRGDNIGGAYGRLKEYGKLNTQPVEQWTQLGEADEKKEVNSASNWQMNWGFKWGEEKYEMYRPEADKSATQKGQFSFYVTQARERAGCFAYHVGMEKSANQVAV